ncbi:MAG: hypothetical protein HQL51_10560 [Magnetococcales bacterium]|nr:hypothetical protein [Magnetococcales bacterium]
MAVTNESSTQIANIEAIPPVYLETNENHGRLRVAFFDFTQGDAAGDATSTARLCKLPGGKVRILLPLSYVHHSALGAARTIDLGHEAYVQPDGTAVAADPDDLDADVDGSAAGAYVPAGTLGTHETKIFESRDGVILTAQVNDATLPAAATLSGFFVYVQD